MIEPYLFRPLYASATETLEAAIERFRNKELLNHDASYNVLFPNGTVKTFSDGGKEVRRALIKAASKASYSNSAKKVLPHYGIAEKTVVRRFSF